MFPALPFFFVWALLGARGHLERLLVVLVTVAPPAVFFLSSPTHLKLLAHVPVLNRLAEPLGYRSIISFSAFRRAGLRDQLLSFPQFARRYESWAVAAAGLLVGSTWLYRRARPERGSTGDPGFALSIALWLWIMVWHFIIWRVNFKLVLAYFPDFAPLTAVLLGAGFAALFSRADLPRPVRAVLMTTLAAALTLSVTYIRHPLMSQPIPRPFHDDAVQLLDRTADELRTLVPEGERVFLFAQPISAYLAGLDMPRQQLMSPGGTLASATSDPRLVARSGAWGLPEIDRWLGTEAGYAVVSERLMQAMEPLRPEAVMRIRELLRERFASVGHVGHAPWLAAQVYRRVS
jgi:hypothetical protein